MCFAHPVMLWSDNAVENTSRRFANLTYCLWIVSHLHRYCVKKLMYMCSHSTDHVSYFFLQVSFFNFILVVNFLIDLTVMLLCSVSHTLPPSPLYHTAPPDDRRPSHFCIISAIDYNQFVFFILANILTGCVNFTVDTLNTSSFPALIILSLYMVTLALVVTLLHRYKLKLI